MDTPHTCENPLGNATDDELLAMDLPADEVLALLPDECQSVDELLAADID